MATQVILHVRNFDIAMQEQLQSYIDDNKLWNFVHTVPTISREIETGMLYVKKLLPKSLHEHIQYECLFPVEKIEFYLSIGYECRECDPYA